MNLALLLACCFLAQAQVRPLRLEDIPEPIRSEVSVAEINAATAQRLRDGEWDHTIFYALQSQRFTTLAPIEPARSAKAFHESGVIPPDAAKRIEAFFRAKPEGERHQHMRSMVRSLDELRREYERAMRFLYEKEWASRASQGADRRDFIAGLYQSRGHSTDTELRATYGVHIGLTVLKQTQPELRIRKVLLIGPGLDWAPRTGLRENAPPQSYQPYALADSLLRLGLAGRDTLSIDCVDINPRVIDHINAFPASPRRLTLHYAQGDAEWNTYFDKLGEAAGRRESAIYTVGKAVAQNIRGLRMNVLSERLTETYDLAIATNVLLYFDDKELGLALANIAHALKPEGHLLHNDLRSAIDQWAQYLQLPAIHARTVRIDPQRELYDGVVLHQVKAQRARSAPPMPKEHASASWRGRAPFCAPNQKINFTANWMCRGKLVDPKPTPRGLAHMLERVGERRISLTGLQRLQGWVRQWPVAPDGDWYKDFGSFILRGAGKFPKAVLEKEMRRFGNPIDRLRFASPLIGCNCERRLNSEWREPGAIYYRTHVRHGDNTAK